MTAAESTERLRSAAIACFLDVDALVAKWALSLRSISTYQEGLVEHEQVRLDCRLVFERLLGDIGGFPVSPEAHAISERVGHSRALRGVPLSDLLTAVRLDFTVLWEALLSQLSPTDADLLAHCVPRIWEAVERHSQEVTQAYTLTQQSLPNTHQNEAQLWFTRLLDTDGRNHVLNTRASEVLGFPQRGGFLLIAAIRESDDSLLSLAEELRAHYSTVHLLAAQHGAVLLVPVPTELPTMLHQRLTASDSSVATIGPVTGLHLLPAAVRLLHAVAPILHTEATGATSLEDHWALAVFASPDDARPIMRHLYITPLLTLPEKNRDALFQVARTYLQTGSISETARLGFFHRNTVMNRLEDLAGHTGLDIRTPAGAMAWTLAMAAAHGTDGSNGSQSMLTGDPPPHRLL